MVGLDQAMMNTLRDYSHRQLVSIHSRLFRVSRVPPTISPTLHHHTMAQPRTPLGQISGNRQPEHELSPCQRGQIIELSAAGTSQRKIAAQLSLSKGAIQYTLDHKGSRPGGLSAPRRGHPPKYTLRETRKMLRCV